MKIMLDVSPRKIHAYTERYGYDFWQLRTPLTQNKLAGVPYGLDNGCFTNFDYRAWVRMVSECDTLQRPEWVSCPDMVGDAARTQELYEHFARKYLGVDSPMAFQHTQPSVKLIRLIIFSSCAHSYQCPSHEGPEQNHHCQNQVNEKAHLCVILFFAHFLSCSACFVAGSGHSHS